MEIKLTNPFVVFHQDTYIVLCVQLTEMSSQKSELLESYSNVKWSGISSLYTYLIHCIHSGMFTTTNNKFQIQVYVNIQ